MNRFCGDDEEAAAWLAGFGAGASRESRPAIFRHSSLYESLARLRELAGNTTTRTVTVHRSDGSTYQRQQQVSTGEPEPEGGHRVAELHDDDKHAITSGIDKDIAALPTKPPEGVVAKAKDIALTAAAKAYMWAMQAANSKYMGMIADVLEAVFDVPSDMMKLAYNPTSGGGQDNSALGRNDFVRQNLADATGMGLSGHLVASIASKVLVKAGYWVKKKLTGEAIESLDAAVSAWAEMIAQLLTHVAAQMGVEGVDVKAEVVEANLRKLLKGKV